MDAFTFAKGFTGVVVFSVRGVAAAVLGVTFAKGLLEDEEPKENVDVGSDGTVAFIDPNKPPVLVTGGFDWYRPPFMPF